MTRIDSLSRQWHIDTQAKRLTVLLKIIGCNLETMVNMNRVHLPWPLFGTSQEQGC
jgi:hypothetical protein